MLVNSAIVALAGPASKVVQASIEMGRPEKSFASVVGRIAEEVTSSIRKAEATSVHGLHGSANVQEVVASVMEAERNLQTAVALRDKFVSAYQEIIRMQI